jgi:hypothetical protein
MSHICAGIILPAIYTCSAACKCSWTRGALYVTEINQILLVSVIRSYSVARVASCSSWRDS